VYIKKINHKLKGVVLAIFFTFVKSKSIIKNMNKMAYIIITVITALLFGLYAYYGGFHDIKIETKTVGGEVIVYKKVTGDYKQTSSVTTEIYDYLLNNLKIETYKGIGIFYDNPKNVKKEDLKSEVGCIIEAKDVNKLNATNCKYRIKQLPYNQSPVAEFPYKGGLSILIGLSRVHPKMEKYVEMHNLPQNPVTEIYDVPNKKIVYRK